MAEYPFDGGVLYYEGQGKGDPILFIHGVTMSCRFFARQIDWFARHDYHALALDLRGHGRSSKVMRGHTIPTYAQDVHAFIEDRGLKNVTLVGWSMGAFVMWDYIRQFGTDNLKASIVIDEAATDYKWPGYDHGFAETVENVAGYVNAIQTDWHGFIREFSASMFATHPSEEDARWMFDEISRVPPVIASTILTDEIFRDYRDFLTTLDLPTLICGGRAPCLAITVAALEDVRERIKGSKLEIFENSGHCPFLEETDEFNKTVHNFLEGLD